MNPFSEDIRRDPHPWYAGLRARSPVAHLSDANLWLLMDHASVKWALSDTEAFTSQVGPARGNSFEWLLFMDPPRHTRLRALVQRAFTPRSVAALEPRIHALAERLLQEALVPAGGERDLDVVAELAVPLPMMVMAELIGFPTASWPQLKRWSDVIVELGVTIVGDAAAARAAGQAFIAADADMEAAIGQLVEQRRSAPADDLLSRLALAEVDGGRLTDREILRFVQLLLAAGTETTTNLVDNALLCLLDQPDHLRRLQAEPALLPPFVEEVLRFRSPAQAMFRVTRRELDVAGTRLPAGAFVMAMLGAANRDPAVFVAPDRFDPTRDPNPHVAFGSGIHFCLGAPLSRLEARILLGRFLARVDELALAGTEPWPPRRAFHVHGPSRLDLRVRMRPPR